ncbi:hypothetical protein ES703_124818 [subsurface metagenome]
MVKGTLLAKVAIIYQVINRGGDLYYLISDSI